MRFVRTIVENYWFYRRYVIVEYLNAWAYSYLENKLIYSHCISVVCSSSFVIREVTDCRW